MYGFLLINNICLRQWQFASIIFKTKKNNNKKKYFELEENYQNLINSQSRPEYLPTVYIIFLNFFVPPTHIHVA